MPAADETSVTVVGGKYRLLECIGSGGMSDVYRAENTAIGRVVAVKILRRAHGDDPDLARRLAAEARTVSAIRHPAIVDVLDAGTSELGPFVVMEYLQGASAARVLGREGRLHVDATLAIIMPVLDALAVAHDAGVVHRDIKPENLFVHLDPHDGLRVKLLDFGIAKALVSVDGSPRTETGVVFGTPDYMSPEQANGESNIDARSDLFSIGVVLFELLTGERPFQSASAVSTAYKIAHARAPKLSDRGGPASAMLEAIIARALQKLPAERYGSVRELQVELAKLKVDLDAGRDALRAVVASERPSTRAPGTTPGRGRALESERAAKGARSGPLTPPAGHRPTPVGLIAASTPTPRQRTPPRARGIVLRAVDAFVTEVGGASARNGILEKLGHELARDFLFGTIQGIVRYDLESLEAYMAAATQALLDGRTHRWRAAGSEAVSGELAPVLKNATAVEAPQVVLRRAVAICERMFDFGFWTLTTDESRVASIRITGFEALGLPLRSWLVGVLEGIFREANGGMRLTISRGDVAHSPVLAIDVTW